MVHTFEDIGTRTPANPNKAAPEVAMPQAAWKALLRDAVQGLRPPQHYQNPLSVAADHPPPGMGHLSPTGPPPHHHHHAEKGKGKGKGRASERERTPWQGGDKRPKVAGRPPQGQGTGGDTTRAQETIHSPGKGTDQGPWHRGRGRNDGPQGAHTGRARHNGSTSIAPPPADTARLPEAHTRQDAPPRYGPDAARTAAAQAHRPPDPPQPRAGTFTRGEGPTPTKGAAYNTAAQPATTPSPPGDDPGRSKGHHTGNDTGIRRGRGHGRDTQD